MADSRLRFICFDAQGTGVASATLPFVQRYTSSQGREIRRQTKRNVARHARSMGKLGGTVKSTPKKN